VARQPTLLLLAPDTLRNKVAALQRLLGGADYQIALMLLAKQPSLAGFSAEVLEEKHAAICGATGLAPVQVRLAADCVRLCVWQAATETAASAPLRPPLSFEPTVLIPQPSTLPPHPPTLNPRSSTTRSCPTRCC
jgi:hypothetical protein